MVSNWNEQYESFLLEPLTLKSGIYSQNEHDWKVKHFPKLFFKYGNLSKDYYLEAIENDYIYLNSIDNFKDENECCATVIHFNNFGIHSVSEEWKNKCKQGCQRILSSDKYEEVLENSIKDRCSITEFLVRIFRAANYPENLIEDATLQLKNMFDGGNADIYYAFQEMLKKGYLIGCVTHDSRSKSMWEKYAEHYTGICIEYEILPIIQDCFPVFYYPELPDLDYITKNNLFYYAICRKTSNWSFEKELRIIQRRNNGHYLPLKAKSVTVTEHCCRLADVKRIVNEKKIPLHIIPSHDICGENY